MAFSHQTYNPQGLDKRRREEIGRPHKECRADSACRESDRRERSDHKRRRKRDGQQVRQEKMLREGVEIVPRQGSGEHLAGYREHCRIPDFFDGVIFPGRVPGGKVRVQDHYPRDGAVGELEADGAYLERVCDKLDEEGSREYE